MHIKKFQKKMLKSRYYPYRKVARYLPEEQTDYLWYLTRKITRGQSNAYDIVEWFKAVGELPEDFRLMTST